MNFREALEKLGIEEYAERIWHSNSHGELFHLDQYIRLAESIIDKDSNKAKKAFMVWFEFIVKYAEDNWKRPESIFQHIQELFNNYLKEYQKENDTT